MQPAAVLPARPGRAGRDLTHRAQPGDGTRRLRKPFLTQTDSATTGLAGAGPQQLQQGRAQRDEGGPQAQRGSDPEDQHPLLVLAGHPEGRHDDHEGEQVVGRQALLHDVAREELGAYPRPSRPTRATRTPPPSSRRTPTTLRPHGSRPHASAASQAPGQTRTAPARSRAGRPSQPPSRSSRPQPCASPRYVRQPTGSIASVSALAQAGTELELAVRQPEVNVISRL